MKMSMAMIISDDNFIECMVTILSVIEQSEQENQYSILFLENNLHRKNEKSVHNFFKDKMQVKFIRLKEGKDEDDIAKIDLRKLKETGVSKVLFLQSNVIVRKNINYLLNKYDGNIVAGKNVIRSEKLSQNDFLPYDLGFIFLDLKNITNEIFTFNMAVKMRMVKTFEIEEYFYLHPMISLKETNDFFKNQYCDLDMIEASAAVVKLYSSIETRMREKTIIAKEWMGYLKEIPGAVEKIHNKVEAQVIRHGVISKKVTSFGTEFAIGHFAFLKKRYTGIGYTIFFLNIPIIRSKTNGFFVSKYFLFLRVSKEFNFSVIDESIIMSINEIANQINKASSRLRENYITKHEQSEIKEKVDSESLWNEANNLLLYDLFKKIKNGEIEKEDEIRAGDTFVQEMEAQK